MHSIKSARALAPFASSPGRLRGDGREQLFLREAQPASAVERVDHEALEAPRRAALVRGRPLDDEGAEALAALQVSVLVQVRQGPRHRVAVDAKEARELSHRRELHARLQAARADQVAELGLKLHVHGNRALPVDLQP